MNCKIIRKDSVNFGKVVNTLMDSDVLYEDELIKALADDESLNEFVEQALAL